MKPKDYRVKRFAISVIAPLLLALAVAAPIASATQRACGPELNHYQRAASATNLLLPELNSDFQSLTGGKFSLEELKEGFTEIKLTFVSERNRDEVFTAVHKAWDTLVAKKQIIDEMNLNPDALSEQNMQLLIHLTISSFLSAGLVHSIDELGSIEARPSMSAPMAAWYDLLGGIARAHKLCTGDSSKCHFYLYLSGMLHGLFNSVEVHQANNHFPAADPNVDGAYMDVASGIMWSVIKSLPVMDKNRPLVMLDNSPFVAGGIEAIANQLGMSNVDAQRTDLSNLEEVKKLRQPLALLRIKNTVSYVNGFEEVLPELLSWIEPGGKALFLFDSRDQQEYAEHKHGEDIEKLINEGWTREPLRVGQ
ncbi:MAG: hypothetical protein AAF202_11925, partial [Pseudomonadota bacterium]